MLQTDRYLVDLSHLDLPKDEPLSEKIIESYRKLAYALVTQAIEDLMSDNKEIAQSAMDFCLSDEFEHRQARLLWTGWLGMDEEVLKKAAKKRLERLKIKSAA